MFILGEDQAWCLLKGMRALSQTSVGMKLLQEISVVLTEYGKPGELGYSSAQFLTA